MPPKQNDWPPAPWPSPSGSRRTARRHAFVLRRLGRLARDRGDLDRAAANFAQSLDAVESQSQRLGGSNEVRTAYAGQRRAIYFEYIDVLMALGQPARAFDVLERSRARALLMMLAERDLVLDGDLSAGVEADHARPARRGRSAAGRRSRNSIPGRTLRRSIVSADVSANCAKNEASSSTEFVPRRLASPHLQYPQALDLAQVQQALDPGTVMLSYQIGTDTSRLFVVRRSTAAGQREPGRPHDRDRRSGIARTGDGVSSPDRTRCRCQGRRRLQPFIDVARRLYDLLVAPAERAIAAADRVLIVPDGPLHSLPFGALVQEAGRIGRPALAVSRGVEAAAHDALGDGLRGAQKSHPSVVGPRDARRVRRPEVSGCDGRRSRCQSAPDVQGMMRRGYELHAVAGDARARSKRCREDSASSATVYLGAEATEGRAKSIAKTRYLHFATHGLLDARSPLDSALALTVPAERRAGEENGLLQAWEIFEQLRIDADLVTLSACETALGDDVAGEGLIGLTRAFHYAGARTVLASLWRGGR